MPPKVGPSLSLSAHLDARRGADDDGVGEAGEEAVFDNADRPFDRGEIDRARL